MDVPVGVTVLVSVAEALLLLVLEPVMDFVAVLVAEVVILIDLDTEADLVAVIERVTELVSEIEELIDGEIEIEGVELVEMDAEIEIELETETELVILTELVADLVGVLEDEGDSSGVALAEMVRVLLGEGVFVASDVGAPVGVAEGVIDLEEVFEGEEDSDLEVVREGVLLALPEFDGDVDEVLLGETELETEMELVIEILLERETVVDGVGV